MSAIRTRFREQDCRLHTGRLRGRAFRLGNGEVWHLIAPRPVLTIRRNKRNSGEVRTLRWKFGGQEFVSVWLLNRLAEPAETRIDPIVATVLLAQTSLELQYDLSQRRKTALLDPLYTDEEALDRISEYLFRWPLLKFMELHRKLHSHLEAGPSHVNRRSPVVEA